MAALTDKQVKEVQACRLDPIYFIRKFARIRHPERGIIPFDLYPFQENVVKRMLENRFVIIVKGRQMGLSTLMAAYCVWLACFFNAKQILILANKGVSATNVIRKCILFYENIPSWLVPKRTNDNMQSLVFDNASIIASTTTTPESSRGESLSMLIFDEAALIKNRLVEEVWQSARPTLSTGGSCVILSTPKGIGNWFHSMWVKAESGESESGTSFFPIKLHWSLHPERDEAWAEGEKKSMSVAAWASEHECSFEKSGNSVIDADTISWYEKNCIQEPISKEVFDHNLWVWQKADFGKNYIISADVARGDGADYSTAIVSCIETSEQVAEYRGKIPPSQFGDLLIELGKQYNDGMIICENNNVGFGAIQRVLDVMYPRLYWSKKAEGQLFFDPLNWHVPGPDKIPGFQTSGKNRPLVIANWEEMLRTHAYIIRSSRLLDEIKGFIWVNTGNQVRAQAAERMNDDLVMACAIGLFARSTTLKQSMQDSTQVNALLNSITVESGRHSISGSSIQQEVAQKEYNTKPWTFGGEDFSDILVG